MAIHVSIKTLTFANMSQVAVKISLNDLQELLFSMRLTTEISLSYQLFALHLHRGPFLDGDFITLESDSFPPWSKNVCVQLRGTLSEAYARK